MERSLLDAALEALGFGPLGRPNLTLHYHRRQLVWGEELAKMLFWEIVFDAFGIEYEHDAFDDERRERRLKQLARERNHSYDI